MENMYMNLATGSIGTYDEWWYTNGFDDEVNAVDRGEVVEVTLDDNGEWVAAK